MAEDQDEIVLEAEQPELEVDVGNGIDTEDNVAAEADSEESDEDEVIVTIGEDSPPQEEKEKAPEWVKELRKTNRELQKENRELKARQEAEKNAETKPVQLGEKPTLEGLDYDSDAYERELSSWYERKRKHDEAEAQRQAEIKEQEKAWNSTLETYSNAKKSLKVRDYDEAEYVVQETLSETQQGMIIQGADNPALVVYALGKNPGKAKELSSIKDPVKFAFAVAKLETQLKVNSRKTPPPPEKTVSGTGSLSGTVDSTLEKLRAEAAKTGNFSKVIAYKKSKKG